MIAVCELDVYRVGDWPGITLLYDARVITAVELELGSTRGIAYARWSEDRQAYVVALQVASDQPLSVSAALHSTLDRTLTVHVHPFGDLEVRLTVCDAG